MLSHDERLPIYQRVHDELMAKISAQEWRAGETIPSEGELARQYNISVGTVRKTIDVLVAEGLLERFQGKGTFVRRPRFDSSLFRFFRFQNQSGERRIPQSRILKIEVAEAPTAVSTFLKLAPGSSVIHLSRLRLMDNEPLLLESIWLPHDRFAALTDLKPHEFGDLLYPLYEERCGQIVASAEETLTAEAVAPLHARLLQIETGSPVIVIERLAFSYAHEPIEWRRSRGPANKFLYTANIR